MEALAKADAKTQEPLTVSSLSSLLRKAFVRELLGERRITYKGFVAHTAIDYETEANRFAQSHYFNSELGNTMPLALATALKFRIVVFKSDLSTPLYIAPEIVTT